MSEACGVLYQWLVPTGLIIGHVGVAAKIFSGVGWLDRAGRILARFFAAAVVTLWVLRVLDTGHLPLVGAYDSALSLALAMVLVTLLWETCGKGQVALASLGSLLAGALLSHGRRFDASDLTLTLSGSSWLIVVHAIFAWLAFAVLATNSLLALRILLARGKTQEIVLRWLVLAVKIGFVLHTAMMVGGSISRLVVFGRVWSFDPVEILAVVTWFFYGALLVASRVDGCSPRRLAVGCMVAFVLLVLSYRGIFHLPVGSTYHHFDLRAANSAN